MKEPDIKFDYSELRGRIVAQCGTVAELCRQMDYDAQKMSVKLNHTGFTRADIVKISDFLGITREEIGKYFFTLQVKKSEQEEVV